MFETNSYDNPKVLPANTRNCWEFMETNSAAAVIRTVCPNEWADIVKVLSEFRLKPRDWLKPGGNRGDVAAIIDGMFHKLGWKEARLDLETKGIIIGRDNKVIKKLPIVKQEGYLIDDVKGRIALDVEWNAKDGNLDRDLSTYRSCYEAGVISAGVIITKDRQSLLDLANNLWCEYEKTLPQKERTGKLPIDLKTSTTTTFDKAKMRIRRGVMGTCPVLIVAATDKTWDHTPYTNY